MIKIDCDYFIDAKSKYILVYPDGAIAGIDDASGGYTWKAYKSGEGYLGNIHFFSLEEAKRYQEMFRQENFKIMGVTLLMKEVLQ